MRILLATVLSLSMIGATGCYSYKETNPKKVIATLEKVFPCKFPEDVTDMKVAQMNYRDTTSVLLKFTVSSKNLDLFISSFPSKIYLDEDKSPWGKAPEPVSEHIEWWDPYLLKIAPVGHYSDHDPKRKGILFFTVTDLPQDKKLIYLECSWHGEAIPKEAR